MTRKTKSNASDRVTLALRLADGSSLTIEGGIHAMRFIGRYSRLSAFGPLGSRISVQRIAHD